MAKVATRLLELPLAGGQEGATVRLHPLLTGEVYAPDTLLTRTGGSLSRLRAIGVGVPDSRWSWIPAPAFLIEHSFTGQLLVDTGLHPRAQADPKARMGRSANWMYEFRVPEQRGLTAQLRALGVEPDDAFTVVMTHLHTDHASGVSEFPNATFLVDHREWRSACGGAGVLRGYHRPHFELPFDWRTIDFDGPAAAPFETFEKTIDLFGDGSVRLLSTPGHTRGHLSVLLRLEHRHALLTADAAYTRRTIAESVMPGFTDDDETFRASLTQIQAFEQQTPDALVIPGHDAEAWAEVDSVYT